MVGEALGHGCVRKAYVSEAAKDEYEKNHQIYYLKI